MKNVLITGANKGIGLETAKQLAQDVKPIVRLVTSNSEYVTGEFLREAGTVPW